MHPIAQTVIDSVNAALERVPAPTEGSAKQVAWATDLRAGQAALVRRHVLDTMVALFGGRSGAGTELDATPDSLRAVARAVAGADAARDGRRRPEAAEVAALVERGPEWLAEEVGRRVVAAAGAVGEEARSAKWWIDVRDPGRLHFQTMLQAGRP